MGRDNLGGAPDTARLGAVTFAHRLGSVLNRNIHFHCCVIDGVFSAEGEALQFDGAVLTPEVITRVQAQARQRILRLFKRRELLSPDVVDAMREWGMKGGALNAWEPTTLYRRIHSMTMSEQAIIWNLPPLHIEQMVHQLHHRGAMMHGFEAIYLRNSPYPMGQ